MRWSAEPGLCPRGSVRVPGDKSIAHRALILAALADGESELVNLPDGQDVAATTACLRQLGCDIRSTAHATHIVGVGLSGLSRPLCPLDCGNSGTTMRLLAGVLAGQPFESVLEGDASLGARPMERVAIPLRLMGAEVTTQAGCAPLRVRGGALTGISYETPVTSAQLKSCVLLAGLFADGQTTVTEAGRSRDHSERLLRAVGVDVEGCADTGGVTLSRPICLRSMTGVIPGDISSAAFWLAAAAPVVGADLQLMNIGWNPSRRAFVELLVEWGADAEVSEGAPWHGEPTASLHVRGVPGGLSGGVLETDRVADMIDEIPILALLGAHSKTGFRVRGAHELRFKESDRIATTVGAIRALGGVAEEFEDGMTVPGGQSFSGGTVVSHGDHRIALAAAAIAPLVKGRVEIDGAEVADVSYPGFLRELTALGGAL